MAIPPCSVVEYFNPATQQCYQSSNPPSISPPMPPLPSVQPPPSISWVTHTQSPPLHPFPPPLMPPSLDASCRFSRHPYLHNLQRVMHPYNQAPVNLVHHPAGGGNNIRGFGSPLQSQQHGYHVQHGHQSGLHMVYGRRGYGGIALPSVPAHLSHEQGHRPFVEFQQDQAATPVLQEIPYQNKPQAPTFTFHSHLPQQQAPLQQVPPQQYHPSNIPSSNRGSSNMVRPIPIYRIINSSQIPPRFEVHASTPPSGAVPMMPVPVMKESAGGSMQPPIIETQDLLPVQAPTTAQSQTQLIGVIEIQKDSSSSDTPGLVDPNTSACASVYTVEGTVDAIQQTVEVETEISSEEAKETEEYKEFATVDAIQQTVEVEMEISSEEDKETEEYKEFATTFKSERTKLGYTQADVVQQVYIRYGVSFSQDTLVQFEAGELPLETVRSIKSVIEEWLRDSLKVSEEKIKEFIVYPTSINPKRERKRRILDDVTRKQLENEFRKKKKPNQNELHHIANHFQIEKDFVRNWFCNRRQWEKKLKQIMKGTSSGGGRSSNQEKWATPGRSTTRLTRQGTNVHVPTKKTKIPSPSHDITVEVPSIDPRDVGSLVHQDYQGQS